jgi:hypothetical protein
MSERFNADGSPSEDSIRNDGAIPWRSQIYGDNVFWDDVYVKASDLDENTSNPPIKKQFRNDGVTGSDAAVRFIDDTGSGVSMYSALSTAVNAEKFTIEFWIKPERSKDEYVVNFGSDCIVGLKKSGGNTRISYNFGDSGVSDVNLNIGTWNHVVLSLDKAISTNVDVYVNNIVYSSDVGSGGLTAGANAYLGYEGSVSDGNNLQGEIDLFTVYDIALTASQTSVRWNDGLGTTTLPAGVVDSNRVLYCTMNDASGNTITNTKGTDLTIAGVEDTDFEWTTGIIGTTGSVGIYLPVFEYQQGNYTTFTTPFPHNYKLETDSQPHIHFALPETPVAGQTVVFEIEYSMAQPFGVFPNTQTMSLTYTATGAEVLYSHLVRNFDAEFDMSEIDFVSSEILTTLKRSVADTYPHDVFLINYGVHYQIDDFGSRLPFVK